MTPIWGPKRNRVSGTDKNLGRVRKDYKRGSKMRRRLDAVVKHEEQVFHFDLRVLEALQDMDRILHPAASDP